MCSSFFTFGPSCVHIFVSFSHTFTQSMSLLTKNTYISMEYIFEWNLTRHIFAYSQCRSRTFLGGSKWKAFFAPIPSVGVVHILVVCT
jgi:hypothetical protein